MKLKSLKIFLPVLGISVLIFGLLFKLVLPQIRTVQEARKSLAGASQKLTGLIKKADELETLPEESLKENLVTVNQALPPEKDVVLLINTLKKLAADTGVSLGKLELSPGAISTPVAAGKNGGPKEGALNFRLKITGTLEEIKTFAAKIGTTKPLLGLKSLNLNLKEGEGLGADLELDFYYQPLPAFLGKISDPLPAFTAAERQTLEEIAKMPFYGGGIPAEGQIPQGKTDPFRL